jgi:hypothetical protein
VGWWKTIGVNDVLLSYKYYNTKQTINTGNILPQPLKPPLNALINSTAI